MIYPTAPKNTKNWHLWCLDGRPHQNAPSGTAFYNSVQRIWRLRRRGNLTKHDNHVLAVSPDQAELLSKHPRVEHVQVSMLRTVKSIKNDSLKITEVIIYRKYFTIPNDLYIYIYIYIYICPCSTWTLTKRLEKKLDGNYTRMLRAILNKSWRQHPMRRQLYGHLPPITKTIQVRRARHARHCWRSKDELVRDLLQRTPTYGQTKAGWPARTYIQQLCEDTGCNPEDLPEAMNDREKWREMVKDIRAGSMTWWWWWWWYICVCECACGLAVFGTNQSRRVTSVVQKHEQYLLRSFWPSYTHTHTHSHTHMSFFLSLSLSLYIYIYIYSSHIHTHIYQRAQTLVGHKKKPKKNTFNFSSPLYNRLNTNI